MNTMRVITAKAEGRSYHDFAAQGWTDENLIAQGLMRLDPLPPPRERWFDGIMWHESDAKINAQYEAAQRGSVH